MTYRPQFGSTTGLGSEMHRCNAADAKLFAASMCLKSQPLGPRLKTPGLGFDMGMEFWLWRYQSHAGMLVRSHCRPPNHRPLNPEQPGCYTTECTTTEHGFKDFIAQATCSFDFESWTEELQVSPPTSLPGPPWLALNGCVPS